MDTAYPKSGLDIFDSGNDNGDRHLSTSTPEQGSPSMEDVVTCPKCKRSSPADRRYCSNCGSPLWEACSGCGTLCHADEKFCSNCGENLVTGTQKKIEMINVQLQEANRLRCEYQYDEAIAILTPIAAIDHPQIEPQALAARQRLSEISIERSRQNELGLEALEKAKEFLAEFDYTTAEQLLSEIPEPLRSEEMRDISDDIKKRLEEISTLTDELRENIKNNKTKYLLPKLDRLLALKPDHPKAGSLSAKVQEYLCKSAKKRILTYKYEQAKAKLDQVAERIRTPELAKLLELTSELAWLSWDLKSASFADKTLIAVAKRLHKLSPKDPQVIKLYGELKRRVDAVQNDTTRPLVPWAAPPKETVLGFPVEQIAGFQQFSIGEDVDMKILAKHRGALFVAAGLALQGIGRSALCHNLSANIQSNVFDNVSKILRKRTTKSAWGLDVSSSGLKAIRLSKSEHKSDDTITIESADFIKHKKPLSQASNDVEENALVKETLALFKTRYNLKSDRLCIGMPGKTVLIRRIALPATDDKKISDLVQYEIKHHVPYSPDELAWDYQIMDDESKPKGLTRNIVLIAAVRGLFDKHLHWFHDVGMQPDVVQCDCLAAYNAMLYEKCLDPEDAGQKVTAILDVGYDESNLIIGSADSVWFRNMGVGGHTFSRALVREFNLTLAQAEEQKHNPANVPSMNKFYLALRPALDDLLKEVHRSLAAYERHEPNKQVTRLVGLGGSFQLHRLLRHLQTAK